MLRELDKYGLLAFFTAMVLFICGILLCLLNRYKTKAREQDMSVSEIRYKQANSKEDPETYLRRRIRELGENFVIEIIKDKPAGETLFLTKKIKINPSSIQDNFFTVAHELGHIALRKTWWVNLMVLIGGMVFNFLGGISGQVVVMWLNPLLGFLLAYRKYLDEKKAFDFAKNEMVEIIPEEDLKVLYHEDLSFARICAAPYYMFFTAALFAIWGFGRWLNALW